MLRISCILWLCFMSSQSLALGKLGHNLVCQLSFEHLSLENQRKVSDLLAAIPKKEQAIINQYNRQPKNKSVSFANACIWADAIKKDKTYDHFKPWHYLNVDRTVATIPAQACVDNCLPQGILYHKTQLSTAEHIWDKAQALMFLGHWLGDIHQPLHVSFSSDYGGNKVKVTSPDERCTSLHWLWDECLLSRTNLTEKQWLTLLNEEWSLIASTEVKQKWRNEQVWLWADESFQIVRQAELGYCQLTDKGCINEPVKAVSYSKNYQQRYGEVLKKRILQAAVRLTHILEQTL
jgi:hypothetical protein